MTARPLPVSCFIIAKNEADRLPPTLRAIRGLLDEIIVVDSGSTDGTQQIAASLGARVVFNEWPGFGQQKRFGETQCRNDWILNLDADEVVPPDLRERIAALFAAGEPPAAAYGMRVSVVYPGRIRPRPFARDQFCYRLYDRRRVRFANSTLYDSVALGGQPSGTLKGEVHHFAARSWGDLIAKCDERASYNARHSKPKSRLVLLARLLGELPVSFLKYYLVRTHVLGGLAGLKYAGILSYYRYVRIARMFRGPGPGDREVELNARRPHARAD